MGNIEMLSAGIDRLRSEADGHRAEIDRQTKLGPQAARNLLRSQQALQLATVQQAVLTEEREVIDIACFAHAALRAL